MEINGVLLVKNFKVVLIMLSKIGSMAPSKENSIVNHSKIISVLVIRLSRVLLSKVPNKKTVV